MPDKGKLFDDITADKVSINLDLPVSTSKWCHLISNINAIFVTGDIWGSLSEKEVISNFQKHETIQALEFDYLFLAGRIC